MIDSAKVTRIFDAPIEDVFDAWINPKKLDLWHHPDGYSSKTKINGQKSYEVEMSNNSINQVGIIFGEYLEWDKPNKLVFTWSWDWQKGMVPTKVEVNFKKISENKTEVSLIHSGFADEENAKQHEAGWGMSFTNLEKVLKGGEK